MNGIKDFLKLHSHGQIGSILRRFKWSKLTRPLSCSNFIRNPQDWKVMIRLLIYLWKVLVALWFFIFCCLEFLKIDIEQFSCLFHLQRVPSNVSLYNVVIHGMCLRGKVESAKKLYLIMQKSGLKPDGQTATFWDYSPKIKQDHMV